jgi:hypothetical protein
MEVVNEPISFVSVFDPIGYNIPQKRKQKNWEGRFIDSQEEDGFLDFF